MEYKNGDFLPKVTVIIVNWNGEKFLEQCLTSIMNQTVQPYEIILIDNASSDKSIEIVEKFPTVRIITFEQNLGFAYGNNHAISEVSKESEWIALINPDAFPEEHWLEKLLDMSSNYPDFDFFGSKLMNAQNPNVFDGAGDVYHMSGIVWRMFFGKQQTKEDQIEKEREIFSPCAGAALYNRKVFEEAGGFDEDFFCYVEDVDLGFRLRLVGYRCMYVPLSIVHHIGSGASGGKHSDFSVYHGHRNLVWAYIKNMPSWLFWLCLPLHIGMNFLIIGIFMLRGQGRVILKAKWDAVMGIPKMWRKRRNIQQKR